MLDLTAEEIELGAIGLRSMDLTKVLERCLPTNLLTEVGETLIKQA